MAYDLRILAGHVDRRAGSHVYHQELARRLARRGHRISLVCFAGVPEVADIAEVIEVKPPTFENSRLLWRFAHPLQHRHCFRELSRLRLPPAQVAIGGEHMFLKGHSALHPRMPWIYLPHSLVVDQEIRSYNFPPISHYISSRLYVSLQKWALNKSNLTLRFTDQACRALQDRYGRAIDPRFFVNPMGVEVQLMRERPAQHGIKLLWVGQLIARKRIDVAIGALANLKSLDWHFDIVGDGDCRDALEQQVRNAGLQDRITFHGFQTAPLAWYQRADLLLFPSWLENFPVTMMEAMSNGVPCLAMRGDGVRYHNANAEIVADGVDGFLAGTDDEFCTILRRLLSDPERLRTAGKAAHATVEKKFTWDQHLDRYEAAFASLT